MSTMIGLFCESSLNGPRDVHSYYQDLCRQIVLGDELGYDFLPPRKAMALIFPTRLFPSCPILWHFLPARFQQRKESKC